MVIKIAAETYFMVFAGSFLPSAIPAAMPKRFAQNIPQNAPRNTPKGGSFMARVIVAICVLSPNSEIKNKIATVKNGLIMTFLSAPFSSSLFEKSVQKLQYHITFITFALRHESRKKDNRIQALL